MLEGWGRALIAPKALCTALLESPGNLQQLAPLRRVRDAQVDEILVRQLWQRPDVYFLLSQPRKALTMIATQIWYSRRVCAAVGIWEYEMQREAGA